MPSYINSIKPIKQIELPKLKLIETDSVPKKSQSLREWAMAGGGVPESHKDRADVWHKKAHNYAKGGAVNMQKGGKMGVGMKIADAVADASKQADEILAVKKAAGKLEEAMKAKQAPMTSPHGTGLPLMPRSQGMYIPGVKQEDLPRMPKVDKARAEGKQPAYTERMQDLLDSPTARKKVDKLINKGKDLNVQEWYGTEPLRQVAMDAGLSPDEFNTLIAQLASASQRNPVDQQNKMGSYLHYLSKTGQLPDDAFLLTNKIKRGKQEMPEGTPIELPLGYGSLAQGDIFSRGKQIASGDIMGALPPDKKLGTFYRNYLGNLKPVTVDVNAVRGPIIERGDPRWLASKLVEKDEEGNVIATHFPRRDVAEGRMSLKEAKDRPGFWEAAPSGSEYAGFEDLWQRGAKRHDISPAEAQALGWYGSADVTALKTKPELYIDNLERMIKRTAEQTGQNPVQVLDDVIKGKGYLYKEGGAVHKADGGKIAKGLMGALERASKAADEMMGAQKVLPAAEREANKAKFLAESKTPMVLYHGTTATEGGKGKEAIRRIKPSKEGALGSGVYLTPSSAHASGYSGIANDEAIEMMLRNPLHQDVGLKALNQRNSGNLLPSQEGGNMLPVHAQIRNPLELHMESRGQDPMVLALTKLGMDEDKAARMVERAYEDKGYIGKQVQQRAQAQGYDGLMQYRDGDLSEVVSYNPNAVKSSIGNRGTYDTNEPDLNKAEGGLIREQRFDGGGMAAADFAGAEDDGGSLDKAKIMSKLLADMAKEQGSKEADSLSKPRAATDLLNRGVIANNPLSAIVDMVNMGLVPLDILGSKLTGRDIKVSSDKPFLGSEHVKDLMNKYNITSGEERPMMETALSFASPTGMIKGAQKTAELAKKAPEALSSVRGGLETLSADAQRPFRSATLTMEGVAPDLGQKGGDKFKDLVTKRMISGEGAPVGMERMGGRKTEKTTGQGLYENFAGQQETNPMVGVTIPRAGNLSTNKQLIADIGTAGRELGQEMVAAHKFTPLMFKNPKDATAMMIGGSERLTKDQIQNIAKALPGMIVTHSPKNNSMFVAPFEGDALDYKKASQTASEILGKGAKVQFGKADSNKDIMFRGDYDKMGARPSSAESTEMRNRLKKAEERIVRGPSVSQSGRQSQPSTLTSTVR